MKKVSSGEN